MEVEVKYLHTITICMELSRDSQHSKILVINFAIESAHYGCERSVVCVRIGLNFTMSMLRERFIIIYHY